MTKRACTARRLTRMIQLYNPKPGFDLQAAAVRPAVILQSAPHRPIRPATGLIYADSVIYVFDTFAPQRSIGPQRGRLFAGADRRAVDLPLDWLNRGSTRTHLGGCQGLFGCKTVHKSIL